MNMRETIEHKLNAGLQPLHLEVTDESHTHNGPEGAQSHFKVLVVSERFEGIRLLGRHRTVNTLLSEELAGSVHALAIHALTPEEWYQRGGQVPESPPCRGGGKAGV